MRTESFKGEISSAYGQPLGKKLAFKGTYEAFGPDKSEKDYVDADWDAALDEIREKNEYPKNMDLVNFVNNRRLANARQKEMTATLDANGIKKPTNEDPQFRFDNMVKILVAAGNPEAAAKQIASQVLNFNPNENAA